MAAYTIMEEHSPSLVRGRILDRGHQGLGQRAISKEVRTTTFVRNVISSYDATSSLIRIPRVISASVKLTQISVLEYIEVQKHIKHSTYTSVIQHRRLLDGVVHPNDLSGMLSINRRLREDLLFSKKQLMVSPLEAEKPRALNRENDYLQAVSRYLASKLHFFFDESSMIKTTGSDKYCRCCLL